jgi:hypothetical protein
MASMAAIHDSRPRQALRRNDERCEPTDISRIHRRNNAARHLPDWIVDPKETVSKKIQIQGTNKNSGSH